MNTLGNRIKNLRKSKKLTQNELANIINVNRGTLANWEINRSMPDAVTIKRLAEYFNCTADYLLGITDSPRSIWIESTHSQIPVIRITCGSIPRLPSKNLAGELHIPAEIKGDFIFRVQGDSMVGAGILENDYAICRKTETAVPGEIVAVVHEPAGSNSGAALYYYFCDSSGPVLRTANPDCADIPMDEGTKIIGIMVALLRDTPPDYEMYQKFLQLKNGEAWTGVIETAAGYGIKPEQIKENLHLQWNMIQRMRKEKK